MGLLPPARMGSRVMPFLILEDEAMAKRIELVGGPGDGQTMFVERHQRWLVYGDGQALQQYAKNADGSWKPIDQYHHHYRILED
jgi:hypothetical protein